MPKHFIFDKLSDKKILSSFFKFQEVGRKASESLASGGEEE